MKDIRLLPALLLLAATLLFAQPALAVLCYPDADGDGFGDSGHPGNDQPSCPPGWVDNNFDCDDGNASINPGADEFCNGIDDNCDTVVDENAVDAPTWYRDADGDGYGDLAITLELCDQPGGYVDNGDDCDDADPSINPGAAETCNGVDDDCNGSVDDNPTDGTIWYADADSDGFGDPLNSVLACAQPAGHVTNDQDCDDGDATINPNGTEVCNGLDDDCNGTVDDNATDATTWYADADGDGFGDVGNSALACSAPPGFVSNSFDCDDGDASINPGATEICNGIDDDCNSLIDDAVVDTAVWYADSDGDGYGDANIDVKSCTQPPGFVDNDFDCDDADAAINPGAAETCNGVDDDCNTIVDDNPTDGVTYYADTDNDGFGDPLNSMLACALPPGFVTNDADCDDGDATINPNGTELCNGLDDDCNGTVDDNATDATTWYADADGDTYGEVTSFVLACSAPPGFVDNDTDCDDTDANINPGASEICNSVDDDCNGTVDDNPIDGETWYVDADGDGYGTGSGVLDCGPLVGFATNDLDCDDADAAISPDAVEVCDSIDNNCDGSVDEGGVCVIIECPFTVTGDVDENTNLTSADIIYLVNFVFKGGPGPIPCDAVGDVDCNGSVTSGDIIYMVNHVFKGGPAPCDACTLWPDTWPCL